MGDLSPRMVERCFWPMWRNIGWDILAGPDPEGETAKLREEIRTQDGVAIARRMLQAAKHAPPPPPISPLEFKVFKDEQW